MHELMPLCILAVALLIASNLWMLLRVMRPLQTLTRLAGEIAEGNLHALDDACGGIAEIHILRRSMAGMAGHVRRSQAQSRAYSEALAEGQEAERARIARELHDETVQSLIAVAQSIDLAKTFLEKDSEQAAQMLQMARVQAVESATTLRNLIANLRPPALEELGLVPALEMLTEGTGNAAIHVNGIQRRLSPVQELALFRGVQEALNNTKRHSHAKHIDITINYRPDQISVRVADDGRGFTLRSHGVETFVAEGHYGLMGIRERVEHLGGCFELATTPGKGTSVTLTLPLQTTVQAHTVRDPVCSAVLEPNEAYGYVDYEGERYYFCCPVCRGAFQKEPTLYLASKKD